jgi:serine/threonine-protein kinase
VLHDPQPARKLRPEISAELQEILDRAMERDPRRRYATAADMAWELEHQEQVAVDDGVRRPTLRRIRLPEARRMMLYAGLALVPVVLFGLMLMMAGK